MDDGFVERSMLETHINHIMWVLRIQLQANDIVCTDRDKQTGDVSDFLMYLYTFKSNNITIEPRSSVYCITL